MKYVKRRKSAFLFALVVLALALGAGGAHLADGLHRLGIVHPGQPLHLLHQSMLEVRQQYLSHLSALKTLVSQKTDCKEYTKAERLLDKRFRRSTRPLRYRSGIASA